MDRPSAIYPEIDEFEAEKLGSINFKGNTATPLTTLCHHQ